MQKKRKSGGTTRHGVREEMEGMQMEKKWSWKRGRERSVSNLSRNGPDTVQVDPIKLISDK